MGLEDAASRSFPTGYGGGVALVKLERSPRGLGGRASDGGDYNPANFTAHDTNWTERVRGFQHSPDETPRGKPGR